MPYNVQAIIDRVSQDCRNQLNSKLAGNAQNALIDYTDRINKEMLRWSNWDFMVSGTAFFITQKGQTDYWVGPKSDRPSNCVQTNLNLPDVYQMRKDSVRDWSNFRGLKWMRIPALGPVLTFASGKSRSGQPANYSQDYINTPNIVSIYPAPDNQNVYQPIQSNPIVDVNPTPQGSLPLRMYFVKTTLVDSMGGESLAQTVGTAAAIPANNTCIVRSPQPMFTQAQNGAQYISYNVYAVSTSQAAGGWDNNVDPQTETLQNVSPIPIGTDWYEPSTGLTLTGVGTPTVNSIMPLGGYIIGFQYLKARKDLITVDDVPQVPSRYIDIVVSGVSMYAWALIGDNEKALDNMKKYQDGYRQMVVDKNLFPEGIEFIRPDGGSYVNQQVLGYLPPFFNIF